MKDFLEPFDEIKFAALSKSKLINQFVKNVTIGPNRTLSEEQKETSSVVNINTKEKVSSKIVCHPPNNNSTNLIINQLRSEIEKKRQDKVKEAVKKHINDFREFSEKLDVEMRQRIIVQQQRLMNANQQQELMIVHALEQCEQDMLVQHQKLLQYYKELAEKTKRNNLELEEKEKRKQQIYSIFDRLKADQIEFRNVYHDISNTLKSCKHLPQLKVALGDSIKQLKVLPETMDEVVTQCKNGIVKESECVKTGKLVQEVKEILEIVKQKVIEVNEAEEKASQPPEDTLLSRSSEAVPPTDTFVSTPPTESSTIQTSDILKFVSKSSLKTYTELQTFMQTFESSLLDFLNNDSLKQFRFDCKKAVNIPVNAISATSTDHLTDKYNRLSNLLTGKMVEVGGARVCAANHPQGLAYCKTLLANVFVLQGDLMISSKPEAAFSYSAVIVALWNEHADFGKLLMANFLSQCPYLIPIYSPRTVGQTDEEFYRSQGYRYSDGIVEKQDKFLKRMAGTMRLYAAIIITRPKRGQTKNPHGFNEGWRWLAAFLNLEPKPDITATMLHVFLETAGSTLETVYRKSFRKLMVYICQVYLPTIQRIDSGGPVTRLEVLLQNYIQQGHFESPNGMLPSNFW